MWAAILIASFILIAGSVIAEYCYVRHTGDVNDGVWFRLYRMHPRKHGFGLIVTLVVMKSFGLTILTAIVFAMLTSLEPVPLDAIVTMLIVFATFFLSMYTLTMSIRSAHLGESFGVSFKAK